MQASKPPKAIFELHQKLTHTYHTDPASALKTSPFTGKSEEARRLGGTNMCCAQPLLLPYCYQYDSHTSTLPVLSSAVSSVQLMRSR
jgi:hypothetical protein